VIGTGQTFGEALRCGRRLTAVVIIRVRTGAVVALLLAALAASGAFAAAPRTKGVTGGKIVVGRGAAGITLGMSRAQVIARLGRPFYENRHGYMQYGRGDAMFDVYRSSGSKDSRVLMFGIAGSGFRLSDGNRIFARGGIARLRRRYGKRLKAVRLEDGEPVYRIGGRLGGRKVFTELSVDRFGPRARVGNIFVGFK
jgi:hypothetical protein